MPIPAYGELDGIEGSSTVKGREGMVEILGFDHHVYIPVDVKDSTASGMRRHEQITILCNFGKHTPKCYDALWNGKVIPTIKIHWYMIDNMGQETEYFTHTCENCRITSMKPWMPNVDDAATERYKHMDEVSFRYEKITVTFVDGNIEASDSWTENR